MSVPVHGTSTSSILYHRSRSNRFTRELTPVDPGTVSHEPWDGYRFPTFRTCLSPFFMHRESYVPGFYLASLIDKNKILSADIEHSPDLPSNLWIPVIPASAWWGGPRQGAGCEIRDDRPSGQMNLRFLHDIYFRQLQWPAPDPPRALTSDLVLPGRSNCTSNNSHPHT